MTKIEMMDDYFKNIGKKIDSNDICKGVSKIYNIDIEKIPLLPHIKGVYESTKMAIDTYLKQYGEDITAVEIRKAINQLFGINLDAISSLEGAKISLFSKGQWITRHENDLFVVDTGVGDIDVNIYPTKYFIERTGLLDLPTGLRQELTGLGYSYDKKIGGYYFANPTGEPVPDSFKGQTIGAIIKAIQQFSEV